MLTLLALLTGLASVVLLLGRDYLDIWVPRAGDEGSFDPKTYTHGRVVPSVEGSSHPLWVEFRGELWKAVSDGEPPPVGTEIRVVSIDGLVATIEAADSYKARSQLAKPGFFTRSRLVAVVLWLLSSALCWVATGSPMLALVGVPAGWLLSWVVLGLLDFS